jgi:hypothetical protein
MAFFLKTKQRYDPSFAKNCSILYKNANFAPFFAKILKNT